MTHSLVQAVDVNNQTMKNVYARWEKRKGEALEGNNCSAGDGVAQIRRVEKEEYSEGIDMMTCGRLSSASTCALQNCASAALVVVSTIARGRCFGPGLAFRSGFRMPRNTKKNDMEKINGSNRFRFIPISKTCGRIVHKNDWATNVL